MLIMQKDLLSELHLPKLDLTSLQNVLSQNSARFAYLLKENDYIKNSKTIPLHLKGAAESMVSGFAELDCFLSAPLENAKTTKRKLLCKKSLVHRDNYFFDDLKKPPRPTVPHSTEEYRVEDKNAIKCSESESLPERVNSGSDILLSEGNLDIKLPVTQGVVNKEGLSDTVDASGEEKTKAKSSLDELNYSLDNFSREKCSSESAIKAIAEEVTVEASDENCKKISESEKRSEPAFCVISEVIGNANDVFSGPGDPQEKAKETKEAQLITPKKTTDITKIKGWRRKQFFVEKPTTVEYYSVSRGSFGVKKRLELVDRCVFEPEEPGNVENAFVCDSLDEFLDRDADLKIQYEIPHLYAEFGIKLTSDDIVSRPNLSEEDIIEVGTRYCVPIKLPCDGTDLDDIKEEPGKRVKRPFEDESKPCKVLKLEENKKQSIKCNEKQLEKFKSVEIKREKNSSEPEVKTSESEVLNRWSNVKFTSKLIGVVVYPGPFAPLHPIVQYHLNKLRSYHTTVDENWANFAVSAVLVNDKRCKRKILPAYCCVKIEKKPKPTPGNEIRTEADPLGVTSSDTESIVSYNEQFKLKECSVVIERLDSQKVSEHWCTEHNRYNCAPCGVAKVKSGKSLLRVPFSEEKTKCEGEEVGETVIVSPRASFDKNVASLLAKKVRLLKYNGDTLTSIDCLKTLNANTIEFIKLKFIKESFLTGYISIWFLKPQSAAGRSRAFLSFSQTSPVADAINLKSTGVSRINLPKVLTEIASSKNLDSNEYAILHCNGEIWEIHGSLNIAFGKSDKNVEQIFTSVELPELKKLQDIAYEILKVKSVKWWVLDLTQKFKLMELRCGNFNTVVTRKKFLETITLNLFGFIPLRKDAENRVLGAYVIQRLLPFVLIGPYYLLETHDMTLKNSSSPVPFVYYGEDNVTTNYPLKFFINSVIKNLEQNGKRLEGLWLYDKMFLDSTSYLEVVTTSLEGPQPGRFSTIDIEHGYSLNSLTSSSLSGTTSGIVKRKDGREVLKKVTVYLYFDIFDLGFVEGELQFDNSVIINHPLGFRTKMKSHRIGDWFISIIKRRMDFLPKDLVVRWFITKHKEDLRYRHPFNRLFLGGAHILTRDGIFYLLELSEQRIEELGLDKSDINRAILKCRAIREVRELKKLASLFKNKSEKTLTMEEILSGTVSEIEKLRKLYNIFRSRRDKAFQEKYSLLYTFIKLLNSCRMRFHLKIKMIEGIEHMFRNESGGLTEECVRKLKLFRIGRKYLARLERRDSARARRDEALQEEAEKTNKLKREKLHSNSTPRSSPDEKTSPPYNAAIHDKPPVRILNVPQDLVEIKAEAAKFPENPLSSITLGAVPEQNYHYKITYPRILKSSSFMRKKQEKKDENQVVKTEPVAQTEKVLQKPDGFLKLTSPDLPDNIKLVWNNWSVNKCEEVV